MLARVFLAATVALFTLVYALPLLFAPLRWARAIQWQVVPDDRLALYFGRCLGACAVALLFVIAAGIGNPSLTPLSLEVTALAGGLLCAVHVVGALQRVQPWTEDAEIVLYGLATIFALVFRVGLM